MSQFNDDFHESDGSLVAVTQPDWDAIDRGAFNVEPQSQIISPREGQALVRIARWIDGDGKKNINGIAIRSIIFQWNVIPEMRALTLTQLAVGYGLKKQSIGRHQDQWKLAFPMARNPHMQ